MVNFKSLPNGARFTLCDTVGYTFIKLDPPIMSKEIFMGEADFVQEDSERNLVFSKWDSYSDRRIVLLEE